ncbi:MAG: bifunctional precorrin-2 dehydrogenase/sirohydrochlorin ferrochelatase [candidate division Zixibacteria bacterium]|nr:bifunctional precorrin-2 dehydrogenase/sirohydrochlorin ferrochelatase [candidate division Zixibacteria bacterium]
MANKYMPISISIKTHRCLVVGGGQIAIRKIETMIDFGAEITVVAPKPLKKIEYYASQGRIKIEKREYKSPEAGDYGMVISATDDAKVNQTVYDDCHKAGVLVNVVDNPPLCDFIFPAILKRDSMTISISTDGKAPFLAAHLRIILENIFPNHWTRIVELAGDFRKKVIKKWGDNTKERFASLDRFLSADWKTLIKSKNNAELQEQLDALLEPQPDEDEPEQEQTPQCGDDSQSPITLEFGEDK